MSHRTCHNRILGLHNKRGMSRHARLQTFTFSTHAHAHAHTLSPPYRTFATPHTKGRGEWKSEKNSLRRSMSIIDSGPHTIETKRAVPAHIYTHALASAHTHTLHTHSASHIRIPTHTPERGMEGERRKTDVVPSTYAYAFIVWLCSCASIRDSSEFPYICGLNSYRRLVNYAPYPFLYVNVNTHIYYGFIHSAVGPYVCLDLLSTSPKGRFPSFITRRTFCTEKPVAGVEMMRSEARSLPIFSHIPRE